MSDGTNVLKLEQYNGTHKVGITQLGVGDYAFNYTAPAGAWVHLAFVNNGSQTLLYANGMLQGGTNSVPLPRAYIGAGYVSSGNKIVDYMSGSVDELLCFHRALSASEIGGLYAAGSAGFVRVPQLTGIGALGNNQFQLSMKGLTGKTFSIYRSPDLTTWTRIATGLADLNGSIQFTDTTVTDNQGFYRASQP
jgi:hypothetical protein